MKRLAVPAVILIVIAVVWIIQSRLEHKRITGRTVDNFLELNAEDINRIEIKSPRDTLIFGLDAGQWYLTMDTSRRRADSMSVYSIIKIAAEMKVGNIISQNPERQRDFMVDDIAGTLVQIFRDDRMLSEIIIGKPSNDYSHTYVRKPGSEEVYLAEGPISYAFVRPKTQWLDKTIFSFVPGTINSVEFDYGENALKIWRGDSVWYKGSPPYRDSGVTDSIKTDLFLSTLGTLKANDFANAADSGMINFDNPSLTLKVTLTDGTVRSLIFAAENAETSRVFCRMPEYDDIFVVYKSKFENIKKDLSGF